ncbi:MAG TPA: hypothetical protein VFP61_14495 [Acidimicrobiales bacterium]|nr:hypothetical protein [Acidimicrobiales bacterium]
MPASQAATGTAAPTTTAPSTAGATEAAAAPAGSTALAPGYWLATSSGGVAAFGAAPQLGAVSWPLNAPIVGGASTPDGKGYWLLGADGGVFSYGTAGFYGSTGDMRLTKPVVGMATTADGRGYWLVAADGGVFAFGDAGFYGSTGNFRLARPIVGMAAVPGGRGYWLVGSDGGVFAFGNAPFDGSTGAIQLARPINGIASTADGHGYWMVASDGGVFAFGDAPFLGSLGGTPQVRPTVALIPVPMHDGYWLVDADGAVSGFGDAPVLGDGAAAVGSAAVVTAMAYGSSPVPADAGLAGSAGVVGASGYASGSTGYDISWPQCGGAYPPPAGIGVIGVEHGYSFSVNGCLAAEAAWAGLSLSLYMNLDSPGGSNAAAWQSGPAGACQSGDLTCESYNWGYNNAVYAYQAATARNLHAGAWWLDVETGNTWSADTTANDSVVAGAIDALHARGVNVNIYSTSYQWGVIAGAWRPGTGAWYATGPSTGKALSGWCSSGSFAGGRVVMVQSVVGNFDNDYSC